MKIRIQICLARAKFGQISCAIQYSFSLHTKVVIGCSEINWSVAGFCGGIEA